MKLYQASQQKYKTDIKKKVKRQVQIVKPDATDEEVDNIMRSDGGRDALYREQILAGGVNDQVKTTYAKVAGKYQDVLALESSVAELHQMFLDFALLTEQQGELLDQIEFQVRQAGDYIGTYWRSGSRGSKLSASLQLVAPRSNLSRGHFLTCSFFLIP